MSRAAMSKTASPKRSRVIQIARQMFKLHILWIVLISFFLLSGCVRDDVSLSFRDANHGVLTQRIRLSSQLVGINRATADLWLKALIEQTQQIGGTVQQPAKSEWVMTLPFNNVNDLVQKFGQFQQVIERQTNPGSSPGSSPGSRQSERDSAQFQPVSNLQIATNNLILWQRYHLSYDLDLRALGIVPNVKNTATVLVNPQELLVLVFELKTPWGARLPTHVATDTLSPEVYRKGRELVWMLQPGAANHLEAVFWLPSSVGIGGALIAGLVIIGMFLKAWIAPASQIVSSDVLTSD